MKNVLVSYVMQKIAEDLHPLHFLSPVVVGDNLKKYDIRFITQDRKPYRATGYMTATAVYAEPIGVIDPSYPSDSLQSIALIEPLDPSKNIAKMPYSTSKDIERVEEYLRIMAEKYVTSLLPSNADNILEVSVTFNPMTSIAVVLGTGNEVAGAVVIMQGKAFKTFGSHSILDEVVEVINSCNQVPLLK